MRSRQRLSIFAILLAIVVIDNTAGGGSNSSAQGGSMTKIDEFKSGAGDFDFLMGKWKILNKRLKERLKNSNEWIEFVAEHEAWPILNGLGNIDQLKTTRDGKYFEGISLRLFHPETKQWYIYWVDNWNPALQEPVIGAFQEGKGLFYAQGTHEGQAVSVRFIWSDITENSARWEQAYSADNGKTWETNWIMEFTRRSTGGTR